MRPNVSELLEKINRMAGGKGLSAISKLEKDLLKQYLRELYEAVDGEEAIEESNKVKVVTEALVKETMQPDVFTAAARPEDELKKQVPEEVKEEIQTQVNSAIEPTKASINEVIKPVATLNERVKSGGKEIHKHYSAKPLKDMIDLNRRFVFVNELFDGDGDALSKAVSHIDALEDYNTAFDFTSQQLSAKYNWDEKEQPVKLFYKLVKQKFGEE